MARKKKVFSVADFELMIDTATEVRTVSAVVVIAMGQVAEKKMSPYGFAGVLRKASDKIYSISNN